MRDDIVAFRAAEGWLGGYEAAAVVVVKERVHGDPVAEVAMGLYGDVARGIVDLLGWGFKN